MATVRDLCSAALFDAGIVGVGQTAQASDMQRALTRLNWMISQWNQKRWLVPVLATRWVASTGQESYSIGPGNGVDIQVPARPSRIESSFVRLVQGGVVPPGTGGPFDPGFSPGFGPLPSGSGPIPVQGVDYTLRVLPAREDYNKLSLKYIHTVPSYLFYETTYPVGHLYPWPVMPQGQYILVVSFMDHLREFPRLNDSTDGLSGEYLPALELNLAVWLRVAYQLPVDGTLGGLARNALATIRSANTQIAQLDTPAALRRNFGQYNIISNQVG